MSEIFDFLRKVFGREEASVISWLQKRKLYLFAVVVGGVAIYAHVQWPHVFNFLWTTLNDRIEWLLFGWLAALTFYFYRRDRVANEKEFKDNFRYGLDKWEYYGGWRSERESDEYILSITDSDAGGFAKPCRLWNDYIFEFETKIVQSNSAWIIRASDILNYVMLQCGRAEIIPHFRVSGQWFKLQPIPLSIRLPLNEWFTVRITVSGTRVIAKVTVDGKETTLLDEKLLEPRLLAVQVVMPGNSTQQLNFAFSFPLGSVGFREWGNTECAHFRNVRVTKLLQ